MNFDLFKKKKPEIQGSGYTSAYASNPSNYSTASTYANSLSQGKGLPSITGQSLSVPSFSDKQRQVQSIVGQANNKIQGSGYSSNYAQNPSNISVPKVEQKQQTQQSSVPSYIGGYQNLAEQKKALLDKQRQQGNEYYQKSYDEKNRLLQESIPALQQQFLRTQANTQKGIDAARQTADYAKQNAEQNWGTSQRQAAQTRQESEGRMRNKFAALGTTGSYGAGSYGQAQENVESDFNRFTQEGLRSKEQNLFEVDKQLQNYEIDAQTKLDDLSMQLDTVERQIRSDMTMNALDKQNALDELYNKYESAVMGVEEEMQGVYKDYYTSLQQGQAGSLSDVFMQTGQPQTEADYKYYVENKDKIDAMTGGGAQNSSQNKALGLVDSLLGGNVASISGGFRPGSTRILNKIFGGGQEAAQWEGLKNLLSLAGRGQLKGSGAVSDFEAKMLEKAALAGLDPTKQTEEQFYAGLQQLKNDLQAGGAVNQSQQVQRPSLSSFER